MPTNPNKYVGNPTEIWVRSSWERKLLGWLDNNPSILKYSSEELIIPYVSPVDGKVHRYFPDFIVQYRQSNGEVKKAVIEVKPNAQTKPPKTPKRQTARYLTEVKTYAVNMAKWEAAKIWCDKNGFSFWLFDEFTLGLKKR